MHQDSFEADRASDAAEQPEKHSESHSAPVLPWEVLSEQEKGHYRVFRVDEVLSRSRRQELVRPFYVLRSDDWVNIIPLTAEGDVVLVSQYRHASREITLEIPGGIVDPGETPEQAGVRELLEETGYQAGEVVALGSIRPNPAIHANRCHTFLAKDCRYVQPLSLDSAEEIEVVKVPRGELPRLVAEGAINHALVVVALHWLSLYDQGLLPR